MGLGLDSAPRMDECSSKWHSIIKNISLCLLLLLLVCTIFREPLQATQDGDDEFVFDYVGVSPLVQTPLHPVVLECIVQSYNPSLNASVNITFPNNHYYVAPMNWSVKGKFIYSISFTITGKYSFLVTIFNETTIVANSSSSLFWITISKDDTDNDRIPDYWEKKFGMNITNPYDADLDLDDDGFSNVMEYTMGTNPLKNQWTLNNIYQLKQQIDYFLFSFLCFLFISFFSLFGVRRGSIWL